MNSFHIRNICTVWKPIWWILIIVVPVIMILVRIMMIRKVLITNVMNRRILYLIMVGTRNWNHIHILVSLRILYCFRRWRFTI